MTDFNALFASANTVAIVGCSARPERTSYGIANYLKNVGFQIIPVNPNYDEVLGQTCYDRLQDIPEDTTIDIVDIFRNPRYTADMVEDAVARAEITGQKPTIWTQVGVSSNKAEEIARDAGFQYIKNRCMMVEHSRLSTAGDDR